MFTKPRHKLININISKFRTSCAPDYYITEQPEQLQYFPILQHCIGQFEFNLFRDEPLDRQDRRLSLQWLASVKINNQSPYDLWWSVKFPDWVLAQSWDLSRYLSTEGTVRALYRTHSPPQSANRNSSPATAGFTFSLRSWGETMWATWCWCLCLPLAVHHHVRPGPGPAQPNCTQLPPKPIYRLTSTEHHHNLQLAKKHLQEIFVMLWSNFVSGSVRLGWEDC